MDAFFVIRFFVAESAVNVLIKRLFGWDVGVFVYDVMLRWKYSSKSCSWGSKNYKFTWRFCKSKNRGGGGNITKPHDIISKQSPHPVYFFLTFFFSFRFAAKKANLGFHSFSLFIFDIFSGFDCVRRSRKVKWNSEKRIWTCYLDENSWKLIFSCFFPSFQWPRCWSP